MNPIARILIGGGAISGIVGGSMFLNKYLSNEDIESKLKANKYELLGQEATNDKTWTEILNNYKIVAKKENKYKFDNFLGEDPTDGSSPKALDTLKKKCKETLEKKLSEDKNNEHYEKAKRWCTTPVSIADSLKKEGYEALNTDVNDTQTNRDEWIQKMKNHRAEKVTSKQINELGISDGTDNSKIDEDIKKIKPKCKEIGDTKNHADNLEATIEKFKTWCSNKKDKK